MAQLHTSFRLGESSSAHAPRFFRGAWLFFFFSLNAFAQGGASSQINDANEAYQVGNCERAIRLYESVVADASIDTQKKNMGMFRIAYCNYSLKNYEKAENGFSRYLKVDPTNEEARLKYLASLFEQGKWAQVVQNANGSNLSWSQNEIRMMVGRSFLEMREPEKALDQFSKMTPGIDLIPTQQYWMGVAEYQRGNRKGSWNRFYFAQNGTKAQDWIKTYSEDWIRSIKRELKPFYGSLTLGGISDGNLSSTSVQSSSVTTGLPTSYAADPTTYVTDTGTYASVKLNGTWHDEYPLSFGYQVDWSSPFYSKNKSYNNENLGIELNAQYVKSSKERYHFALKYLDSRYLNIYYQDYLIFTPGYQWNIDPKWTLTFDLPITRYVVTRSTTMIGPLMGVRHQYSSWLSLTGGLNFSNASGDAATYSGTTVISGTQFSTYKSYGANVGFSASLPFGLYFSSQVSYYKTNYADEKLAALSGTSPPASRSDSLVLWSSDLTKEITDRWTASLNYNYYSNTSSGFQGVVSSSTMTIYSYTKPYWMLSSTIQF